MTANGDAADADLGAEVVGVEAEVVGGRRAEDGDAQVALDATSVRNEPCQTS